MKIYILIKEGKYYPHELRIHGVTESESEARRWSDWTDGTGKYIAADTEGWISTKEPLLDSETLEAEEKANMDIKELVLVGGQPS